jgi:hypothetical protein
MVILSGDSKAISYRYQCNKRWQQNTCLGVDQKKARDSNREHVENRDEDGESVDSISARKGGGDHCHMCIEGGVFEDLKDQPVHSKIEWLRRNDDGVPELIEKDKLEIGDWIVPVLVVNNGSFLYAEHKKAGLWHTLAGGTGDAFMPFKFDKEKMDNFAQLPNGKSFNDLQNFFVTARAKASAATKWAKLCKTMRHVSFSLPSLSSSKATQTFPSSSSPSSEVTPTKQKAREKSRSTTGPNTKCCSGTKRKIEETDTCCSHVAKSQIKFCEVIDLSNEGIEGFLDLESKAANTFVGIISLSSMGVDSASDEGGPISKNLSEEVVERFFGEVDEVIDKTEEDTSPPFHSIPFPSPDRARRIF